MNNQDIVQRLEIKADCIQMGEKIAWGSDSAIMREAADIIRRQKEVINDTTCESIIAIEALEQIKKLDGEASVIAKAALDKIAAPLLKEKNDE